MWNKKVGLQKRVDTAKEQYKLLLDELNTVQELIDKEQQQLTAQSEAYAKILKEETKEAADEELSDVDQDANDHVLTALAQVGILYTDSQKSELERHLAENLLKCRKKPSSQGNPGSGPRPSHHSEVENWQSEWQVDLVLAITTVRHGWSSKLQPWGFSSNWECLSFWRCGDFMRMAGEEVMRELCELQQRQHAQGWGVSSGKLVCA